MVQKRKRNVKIDNTEKFEVVNLNELDYSYIEEYSLPPIDSGMEAEEEKELHLKNIITSGQGDIPIPIIEKVENPALGFYKNLPPSKKYISWEKDVDNEYCITKNDKINIQNLNIDEKKYKNIVKDIESGIFEAELSKKIKAKVRNNILLREDGPDGTSYVCFRKRTIKPSRKTRRSEAQLQEKVTRLMSELSLLKILSSLAKKKNEIEEKIINVNKRIYEQTYSIISKNKKNIKKKVIKILKADKKERKLIGDENDDFFKDIMFDRNKIRLLRKRLCNNLNSLNIDWEKEKKALKNYATEENFKF